MMCMLRRDVGCELLDALRGGVFGRRTFVCCWFYNGMSWKLAPNFFT